MHVEMHIGKNLDFFIFQTLPAGAEAHRVSY